MDEVGFLVIVGVLLLLLQVGYRARTGNEIKIKVRDLSEGLKGVKKWMS